MKLLIYTPVFVKWRIFWSEKETKRSVLCVRFVAYWFLEVVLVLMLLNYLEGKPILNRVVKKENTAINRICFGKFLFLFCSLRVLTSIFTGGRHLFLIKTKSNSNEIWGKWKHSLTKCL